MLDLSAVAVELCHQHHFYSTIQTVEVFMYWMAADNAKEYIIKINTSNTFDLTSPIALDTAPAFSRTPAVAI